VISFTAFLNTTFNVCPSNKPFPFIFRISINRNHSVFQRSLCDIIPHSRLKETSDNLLNILPEWPEFLDPQMFFIKPNNLLTESFCHQLAPFCCFSNFFPSKSNILTLKREFRWIKEMDFNKKSIRNRISR
jgi:hypothetical protein